MIYCVPMTTVWKVINKDIYFRPLVGATTWPGHRAPYLQAVQGGYRAVRVEQVTTLPVNSRNGEKKKTQNWI